MMKNTILRRFAFSLGVLLVIALILSSCTARQAVTLAADGSGTCTVALNLNPEFVEYVLDIGEAAGYFPDRSSAALFDLGAIRKTFADNTVIRLDQLQSDGKSNLSLSFSFTNIQKLIESFAFFKKTGLLAYQTGDSKKLTVHMDRTLVPAFLEQICDFAPEEYEYLLPQKGETRESYFETLDFSLENGAAMVKASSIRIDVTVPGTITGHNGTAAGDNTVRFSIPLESLLFIGTPKDYFIVFK